MPETTPCLHEDVRLECPFCAHDVDDDTQVCLTCHEPVAPVRVCVYCGDEVSPAEITP